MKTIKYYKVNLPFSGKPTESLEEYQILAHNKHGKLVINDFSFTTLQDKKTKHGAHVAINEPRVYRQKWNMSSDGWYAYCYFQCSEKVMRRKILNELKKQMSKEMFLDSESFRKLEQIIKNGHSKNK